MTRTPLDNFLQVSRAAIDSALENLLRDMSACPPRVLDAMRHSLFAGGKRFRPILSLAAAEAAARGAAVDLPRVVHPAACAIEMIHTYSLIHDDLPAMDNDSLRRGRPTAHVVYGEGLAILAGDALLTEAFRVLAQLPLTDEPALMGRKLRVAELVASAAGATGMVGGQAVDLEATRKAPVASAPPLLDAAALSAMHERKTASLMRAAAVAGTIMSGGSEDDVAAIDRYARLLGLGFQIIDDILDAEGTTEQLGKTARKDAAAGKATYPSLFGVDRSRRLADIAIEAAKETVSHWGLEGHLGAIADWVLVREN